MGDKLVGGCSECRVSRRRAIFGTVDDMLWMLDAHTHGKVLLREGNVMFFEKLE